LSGSLFGSLLVLVNNVLVGRLRNVCLLMEPTSPVMGQDGHEAGQGSSWSDILNGIII